MREEARFEREKFANEKRGSPRFTFFFLTNKNKFPSDPANEKFPTKGREKGKGEKKKFPIKNESSREKITVSITV